MKYAENILGTIGNTPLVKLNKVVQGIDALVLAKVETFNLGTGTGSSVLEVITSFEKVSDKKLPYKIVARREGDITEAYANTTKANDVLGWKAQSTLDEAMKSAWEWEQKIRSKVS